MKRSGFPYLALACLGPMVAWIVYDVVQPDDGSILPGAVIISWSGFFLVFALAKFLGED